MGTIQIMPDALANQIAAGEVVERPASCVKELIENSLDAGARQIRVALEDGGIASIIVQDDGHGMDLDDATLAFARHATSKVRQARDLFRIATLGFRGEALASIAAVARVRLQTRRPDSEAGVEVRVEGSQQLGPAQPIGAPSGTLIEVRDLFFNTPARLKYLRAVTTEQARCIEVVQRAALARPDVAFTLETNGHLAFQSPGRGNPLDVAASVFSSGEARQLLSVDAATADYRLTGHIGRPTQSKSTRAYGHLFINQRPIRNYALHQAVVAGYGARLMTRRHPLYALYLELDPVLVDVNIHPHKAEVRFSEERDVARLFQDAVQAALDGAFLVPSIQTGDRDKPSPGIQTRLRLSDGSPVAGGSARNSFGEDNVIPDKGSAQIGKPSWVRERADERAPVKNDPPTDIATATHVAGYTTVGAQTARRPAQRQATSGSARPASTATSKPSEVTAEQLAAALAPPEADGDAVVSAVSEEAAPLWRLRPVGQALGMYIIADDGESLYIIDQHAAHERVLYERFHEQVRQRLGNRIALLSAIPYRLSPAQYAEVLAHQAQLAELGLDIEPFGGADVVVRSVPEVWEGLDHALLTEQLLASFEEERLPRDAADSLRERIVTQACKAAIKANHRLSVPEMEALCTAFSNLDDPFHCPHGRPILIRLTSRELEKEFRRIV